jgi:hypothetical protein
VSTEHLIGLSISVCLAHFPYLHDRWGHCWHCSGNRRHC